MNFRSLQDRLLALVRSRVRNGEVTERSLARMAGISQPHLHNALKGIRALSPETADLLLAQLGLTVADLLTPPELDAYRTLTGAGDESARRPDQASTRRGGGRHPRTEPPRDGKDLVYVPVLHTAIGPGFSWPSPENSQERFPVPEKLLRASAAPVVARLAADPGLTGAAVPGQLALFDTGRDARRNLAAGEWYAIQFAAEVLVRRVVVQQGKLRLAGASEAHILRLPVAGGLLEDVVKARVAVLDATRALRLAGYYR
jgi:transcriptional regulator with XRE-family HTH domain